jgi:hypothetical protein
MSWVATFLLGAAFGSSTLMLSQMLLAARRLRRRLDKLSAQERLHLLGVFDKRSD